MNEISALRHEGDDSALHLVRMPQEGVHQQARTGASPGIKLACTLVLDFIAFRNMRNRLVFKPPSMVFLL